MTAPLATANDIILTDADGVRIRLFRVELASIEHEREERIDLWGGGYIAPNPKTRAILKLHPRPDGALFEIIPPESTPIYESLARRYRTLAELNRMDEKVRAFVDTMTREEDR